MWYVILRHPKDNSVIGFTEDADGKPVAHKTDESANESMEDHMFEKHYELIELQE